VRIPVPLKIMALTVASTGFYTVVGQMVPQKEVHPPKEMALKKDMSQDEMLNAGRQIMEGKGLCFTCHTVGKKGALRFPDLEGIGARASTQVPGLTDVQYLAQSIYEPDHFIVPGFSKGMPVINKPPIGLSDDEIKTVIAYLQSMGGKPSVTMASTVWPLQAAGTTTPQEAGAKEAGEATKPVPQQPAGGAQ
jgi:mono/diheme cytochrome c family protein